MSRYNRLKQPRSNNISLRSLVVLFVATMAVSLLILIILFNLVFKNIDLNFKTRVPESAPLPPGELQAPAEGKGMAPLTPPVNNDATNANTPELVEPETSLFQPAFRVNNVVIAHVNAPGRRPKPVAPLLPPVVDGNPPNISDVNALGATEAALPPIPVLPVMDLS